MISLRTQCQPDLSVLTTPEQTPQNRIYLLQNSGYFFLDFAFILVEKYAFRLIIFDGGENYLVDTRYKTARGAKSVFFKRFKYKYCQEDPKAEWSPPYAPDEEWLRGKLNFINALPETYRQKRAIGKAVSFLANPGLFSLDSAFIVKLESGYRLMAIDLNKKAIFDIKYNDSLSTRMVFGKKFGNKSTPGKSGAIWTPFSQPVEIWWKQARRFLDSGPTNSQTRRKIK